jgi:hypothetical protein
MTKSSNKGLRGARSKKGTFICINIFLFKKEIETPNFHRTKKRSLFYTITIASDYWPHTVQ